MYYLSSKASRIRQREAQNARNNRAEIVKALSIGQITRRDLYKWGLLTFGGLAVKNGLSPFARSAFAAVPTGTPRSPLFNAQKFTQPLPRLRLQTPQRLIRSTSADPASFGDAAFPAGSGETLPARRLSYHTDFTANPCRPAIHQSHHRKRSGRGPPTRGDLCPSAVERVLSPGRLCDVMGADRAEQQVSPEFPGPESQQRVGLWHGPFRAGLVASVPHQASIWAAGHYPDLQQHSGQPGGQWRLRSQ